MSKFSAHSLAAQRDERYSTQWDEGQHLVDVPLPAMLEIMHRPQWQQQVQLSPQRC